MAAGRDRFIQVPELHQHVAQYAVGFRPVRFEFDSSATDRQSFLKLTLLSQYVAQVDVRFSEIGPPDGDGGAVRSGGVADGARTPRSVLPRLLYASARIRSNLDRRAIHLHSLVESTSLSERVA